MGKLLLPLFLCKITLLSYNEYIFNVMIKSNEKLQYPQMVWRSGCFATVNHAGFISG